MLYLIELSALSENAAKGIYRDGESYLIIQRDGEVYVYQNSCPHLGIPLEWQQDQFLDDERELIRCATHGALFTIEEGLCISGPCNGQHLRAVNHVIQGEKVFAID